jgi:hypothetical protein
MKKYGGTFHREGAKDAKKFNCIFLLRARRAFAVERLLFASFIIHNS